MHERERHRFILSAVQDRPVVTVVQLVEMTDASEATIRRDIAALHLQGRLRRVRGGAEAVHPPQFVGIAGRPFSVNEGVRTRTEAADRPRRGRALRGRRLRHHQWRHDDLSDGALPRAPPASDPYQLIPDRRAPAQALAQHRCGAGRRDLSRAEHHPQPIRQRRDAELLRAADVHGCSGRQPDGRDGRRSASHPGGTEAHQSGGGAHPPR